MQRLFFVFLGIIIGLCVPLRADIVLGDAPKAPTDLTGLPGMGPSPRLATNLVAGGLSVDTSSREQVREFYNAVYTSSTGVPMNSTADTATCFPGTNSPAFVNATLLRINWFRAMAGIPAAITFDATACLKDQAAAVMLSEHGALQHVGSWAGWNCVSSYGTNATGNSNLALGNSGPDAITAYMVDNGNNNPDVGHRRWILYPQTQVMGTGDVPQQNLYPTVNATWVFDSHYGGPRPATRQPYVAWPPSGYVPYPVVSPRWSLSVSNANMSNTTVAMTSNGVAMAVSVLPVTDGYGENTVVWYVSALDQNNSATFPFNGTDTVYTVTVSNIKTSKGTYSISYNVTLFDPATTGPDYVPTVVNGPNQATTGTGNAYTCTPPFNPYTTGFQWVISQTTNGDLVDLATNGLTNFTFSPAPAPYPIITNPPVGTGKCFHLCHANATSQILQLNEVLCPTATTTISFKSYLGYATSDEIARVEISTDSGTTWTALYSQAGSNGAGESAFTQRTLSLSNYVNQSVQLRFNYYFMFGGYYPQNYKYMGWSLENIVVTNSQKMLTQVTNTTTSTNLVFTPTQTGNYLLQARGIIFGSYPIDFGNAKTVTAIAGAPLISVNSISVNPLTVNSIATTNAQVRVSFTASGGANGFRLLQAPSLGAPWTTNTSASLTTNLPGSYQFILTNSASSGFYRVVAP